jgi:FkbM family methyltransferase
MQENFKALGRAFVRVYLRTPFRGKSRLRSLTDRMLMPAGGIEQVPVGPCLVPLSHDHEATRNMAYGAYEPVELTLIRTMVSKGDTVLDIGANVGYFSAQLADMVGPNGRVLSFEPGPTPLQFLRRTAASNKFQNIEVVPCAVSGRSGTATFYETDVILSKGYGRIDERPSAKFKDVKENTVEVLTPADLFQRFGLGCPTFVKIDVEGQEKNVILGFEPIFRKGCCPILMTEVTIEPRWQEDLQEYAAFLAQFGYTMHKAEVGCPAISINDIPQGFHGNVFWLTTQTLKKLGVVR